MTVAKHPEKFTTLRVPGPARKRLATPELPQTQGAFRMALIPTDWGTAGILWQESPRRESSFSHAPANGLLSRILTPGFPPAPRNAMMSGALVSLLTFEETNTAYGRFSPVSAKR